MVTPPLADAQPFLPTVERALDRYQPAALLLRLVDGLTDAAALPVITAIAAAVQPKGVALMLEDRPALARQTGCDGVHLSANYTALNVRDVRRMLGDELQLGVAAGTSRDAAMQAGEDGADYISFGPEPDAASNANTQNTQAAATQPPEIAGSDNGGHVTADAEPENAPVAALAQWWSVMMELPVVACARTPDDARQLASGTADFLMPSATWWDNPTDWPTL
nr:thiamine phosphate synthase [Acetobacter garciniae]